MHTTEVTSSYNGSGFAGGPIAAPSVPEAGSGSATSSRGSCKHPFDVVTENKVPKVSEGVVYVGSREEVEVEELALSKTFTGTVYLVISWSEGSFEGELTTTAPSPSGVKASRKLYDFKNGKPTMDYRCAPVFVLYN